MDYGVILGYIQSALVPIVTFVALLFFAIIRGRRAITSLILGLYFALLISLKFPYYTQIYNAAGFVSDATIAIILFAIFTTFCAMLMDRMLFYRIDETAFEGFGKKSVLALLGTIVIMLFSYHVLPIASFIDPGLPASALFASADYFFWWLLAPLVVLFIMY